MYRRIPMGIPMGISMEIPMGIPMGFPNSIDYSYQTIYFSQIHTGFYDKGEQFSSRDAISC